MHCCRQFGSGGALQHITRRAGAEGFGNVGGVGMDRDKNELAMGRGRADLTSRFQSVEVGHGDIQQHHVGMIVLRRGD